MMQVGKNNNLLSVTEVSPTHKATQADTTILGHDRYNNVKQSVNIMLC